MKLFLPSIAAGTLTGLALGSASFIAIFLNPCPGSFSGLFILVMPLYVGGGAMIGALIGAVSGLVLMLVIPSRPLARREMILCGAVVVTVTICSILDMEVFTYTLRNVFFSTCTVKTSMLPGLMRA